MRIKKRICKVACFMLIVVACGCSNSSVGGNADNNSTTKPAKSDTVVNKNTEGHSKLVNALVRDTMNSLNYTDANGKRQGHWIVTNRMKRLPGYDSNAKIEEGDYQDDIKEGQWTEYNADGSIKSTVNYKDGKPIN